MEQANLISINGTFAKHNNLPSTFTAVQLRETQKAVYVYGHGEVDPHGTCVVCGRTLTHPGSIVLGIGPECLGSWGMRDAVKDSLTPEQIKAMAHEKLVDCWIPKSIIKIQGPVKEEIVVPENHKMLASRKKKTVEKEAVKITYQQSGKEGIKITFPFDREDLNNVKTLPGRQYHGNEFPKYWTCPLSIESVEALAHWGFKIDPALTEFVNKSKIHVDDVPEDIKIPGLQKELFPFQKKGVSFIEAKNGRALVADSMGLGKTAQSLAWLQLHPECRPAIIVVPASLKLNWERECQMWMDKPNVQVLSGKKPYPIIGDIIIINYDVLSAWMGRLQKIKAQVLVIDEIHLIKNNRAQRTKAVKALGKNIPHIIGLSGTPIVNRPVEAYNALSLIDSSVIPSFWHYAHKYCGAKHNGFGWDFNGATNTEELHQKLSNSIMIRRKKEDVLTDLPDKTRTIIPLEITNQKEYGKAERDFIQWIKETKGNAAAAKAKNAEALAQIEALKQLTIKGKIKESLDWIQNFLDVDGKLIVFAVHKSTIDMLMKKFKDIAVKIDGSVSMAKRQEAVDQFQNNPKIRLFVGNIKAAGVGLTLTAASNVAFLELPWSPGDLDQAEDRAHRISQKNAVNIYYLIGQNTIEETISSLIDHKRKILDSVLDGKETEESSLLSELLKTYQEGA
jgi:SWI/SNF-related matrix-associated actin-dependent regulator 1 of chromatin subfamily A